MAEKKNILLHKRSVQQGVQPSGTTLDYGEIAVNYNVNDPFLSIRTTATGKTDQTYAKFIDESAINDKLSKKSDTSHTHSAYVNQNAFSNVIADSTTIGADTTTDTLTFAKSGAITITGDATNNKITIGISTGTTSSTVAKGNHNHDKVYLKTGATATAAAKVTNALTFGGKTYDGSEAKEITAADLGLSGAMRYIGMVEGLSDGDPSDIITINGVDITPEPGNVVIDTNLHKEYIWNGDCWEEIGSEGDYKVKQNAVTINNSEPTTYTTTSFIYTLSQDENGVISGKNGKIPFAKQNEEGIVKLVNGDITNYSYNDGEAAAAEHNHDSKYKTIQTNVTSPSATGNTTSFIDTISQDTNGVITATKKTVPTAKYNTLGIIKPSKSYTGAATLTTAASSASTAPKINAITTTEGKYYAVEVDKNGVPFVNVPWTDTNDDTSTTESGHYKPSTTASTIGATSGDNYIRGINVDSKNHVISVATGTPANTHYTSKNIVGTSTTATTNGAVTGTTGVYLNHLEETTVKSTHNIVGSGSVTVTSDNNGNITIKGAEYCPTYHVATTAADRDKYGYGSTNQWGHVRLVNGDLSVVTAFTPGLAAAHYHNHNGAYVKKEEFEDNELVVSQALNDLNEAISGVETSISDCVTAPVVDGIPTTTMENSWFINTPALLIGNENSLIDGSGVTVTNMGEEYMLLSPNVMFGKWLLNFGDETSYIYYDGDDDKLKRYWSNGDSTRRYSFATEDWVEDQVRMEYVTYSQLKELRDNAQLVPGRQYRISDYVTTTTQVNTQSAGHQFDVIVTADDNNTLNEVARAIHHQGDTYFSNSDLSAWQIWYCLDNDRSRFPWAFRKNGKTITVTSDGMAVTGEYVGTYTYEGTTYHRWDALVEGMVGTLLTVSDSPNVGDTISVFGIISLGIFQALPLPITEVNEGSNDEGYGVIYRMIDEHNNDLPYDFKNIQFVRKLSYGQLDLDNGTDEFVFTFDVFDNNSGTHYDYSLGEGCYGNIIKKSHNGLNNIVFLNEMLMQYKNCIGNIFGNNCYNITFGDNAVSNTFGDYCYENIFEDGCMNNIFGDDCHDNTFGDDCYDNTFGNACGNNEFGDDYYGNTIGKNCYGNIFREQCHKNTIGTDCIGNTFGNYCAYNTFGNNFLYNHFKDSCINNTFGDACGNNEFGLYSRYNAVGNYCKNIHIGDSCDGNTFGNDCERIYFGSENALISYCQHIIFDNGTKRVNLNSTQTTTSTAPLQNIHVSAGVSVSENLLSVNIDTVGQNYTIEVAKNSAGVVKTFCMADLIA